MSLTAHFSRVGKFHFHVIVTVHFFTDLKTNKIIDLSWDSF